MRHQSAASLVVISAVMVLAGGSFGPAPAAFPHSAASKALDLARERLAQPDCSALLTGCCEIGPSRR